MIKKQYKNHLMFEIQDSEKVSSLGMKTISKQMDFMLPVRKIKYNDKIELICNTDHVEKELIENLSIEKTIRVVKSLADLLFMCEESAFIDQQYIDFIEDTVFLHPDKKIYLFPVIPVDEEADKHWNDYLRKYLLGLFKGKTLTDLSMTRFVEGIALAEDVADFVKENIASLKVPEMANASRSDDLELKYDGVYGSFTLYICKDEFVIGKSADCDGVLSMNPTVSRHHCVVKRGTDGWYLSDLGSSNGTMAFGNMLVPSQQVLLQNNMVIRISDMDFVVTTK